MLLTQLSQGIGRMVGPDVEVRDVQHDSRDCRPGDLYCAVVGRVHDGHSFIADALRRGAAAVCVSDPSAVPPGVPGLLVEDTRQVLGPFSARIHGDPTQRLRVFGVTGTNGKTTTTYLLRHILRLGGRKVDLVGTVERTVGGVTHHSKRTTPEATDLQRWFGEMLQVGTQDVTMEVSSHALDLGRVIGVRFAGAVFTNLTQDHLDYHGTLERYLEAKLLLFDALDPAAFGVVNADDAAAERFVRHTRARILRFSVQGPSDVYVKDLELGPRGSRFVLALPGSETQVSLPIAGIFNVQNAIAAAAVAHAAGISAEAVAEALASAEPPPGRFQRIDRGQPFEVVVDYAHTPDGIEKLLRAAREITHGRVLIVFGCGGDRDRGKRPLMGALAGELADRVFLTSDNPRSEDPERIIDAIAHGLESQGRMDYLRIIDRTEAIRAAVAEARPGDILVIAGKGHEDYQLVGDQVLHFDDREEAARALEEIR
ncbi:MAG: UDP-N-acetylmuramoyl-L-alanyl-D-glutamate--2,6-diaminopimelate ligase [Thermaerobacter sp.]|nr:UDP-N-acetylmuramoyl-L-alanyl-D-glutamate--2,6-diaminopimelate ligase [Thermaerobacter sp.]